MRLCLIAELASRLDVPFNRRTYDAATADDEGTTFVRLAFMLRNGFPPSRAFGYWLA